MNISRTERIDPNLAMKSSKIICLASNSEAILEEVVGILGV